MSCDCGRSGHSPAKAQYQYSLWLEAGEGASYDLAPAIHYDGLAAERGRLKPNSYSEIRRRAKHAKTQIRFSIQYDAKALAMAALLS